MVFLLPAISESLLLSIDFES